MAAAAEEDHSTAGKGRAWKRRRNGLPNKKSAIVVGTWHSLLGARKLEIGAELDGRDGIIVEFVGRKVDEGLNYERVHVRRWFQNQIRRDRAVANDVDRGSGEASGSGAWLLCIIPFSQQLTSCCWKILYKLGPWFALRS